MRWLWALGVAIGGAAACAGEFERHFAGPPDAARPWVYWFWKNGNIDRAGITADLESMQRVGIGGCILMEVSLSVPPGPVAFFSPEWRALFAHAVGEADRLGLQLAMNSAPGWTGSGGAWVKPEQSMQMIVASETRATGPGAFDAVLAQPETRYGFYRDVAVLAFPAPAEDRRIEAIEEKALYARGPISSMPGVRPYFPGVAHYGEAGGAGAIPGARIVDLGGRLDAAGRLQWEVPPGDWTVLRFGRTSTGQNNRPAPLPGLECDKLDPAALDAHYDAFIGALLGDVKGLAGRTLAAVHLDSWEVGAQNWTGAMREEFAVRRGYDLLRYLPAMTGRIVDGVEVTERFLWDLRQTVSEMIAEYHGKHLRERANADGLWFSIEPYDMMPGDDMTVGATADVPMGEFWVNTFDARYSVREAVSVAHVYGRPIAAAEAFTSIDKWLMHPGNIKPFGDWAFSEGINRVVVHRFVHQPFARARPGLSLGPHGLHYERTNTWWEYAKPWHEYLARCQYLLQQGIPAADLLYLAPEGAPNVFQAPDPPPAGHKLDACTPEALLTRIRAEDGALVTPEGVRYRALVLPGSPVMTPALAARVRALAEAGAAVIGLLPSKSPSLAGYPDCDARVAADAAALGAARSGEAGVVEVAVGRGRVFTGQALRAAAPEKCPYPPSETVTAILRGIGLSPDFECGAPLRFAHRIVGGNDVYFVSNGGDAPVEATCAFRSAGKAPRLWHPESGTVRALPQYTPEGGGRTAIPLRLEAGESYFVAFDAAPGSAGASNFAVLEPVLEVRGPYTVQFDPAMGGPAGPVVFERLDDWSMRPEDGIRHYAGEAGYTMGFDLEAAVLEAGRPLLLDLGRVEAAARIELNGRPLGIAWKAPYRVDIAPAARAGANTLRVTVVNLWPNRLIGDDGLEPDSARKRDGTIEAWPQWLLDGTPSPAGRHSFAAWRHWTKDSALVPSGLLGPITIAAQTGAAPQAEP